ncbi:Uma2 family endonuclease [Streptomyces alkaliterrae]|uniref:Uma2 family endonuclease n=1 Tax=Streptomyces alkaliterrae TaxID=2213162 RepID=A0A5P0YYK2_9ACTN|nr:Uma2 family endonuclease [Streptomyces alkaliterrae]MBB1256137.1 Uma2 family endonuclease [Streptomyces alkaliterrae]MBB1261523.1 Uma2 family endonuclease [Streptomyces alkaliterrae]MQS04602.1 Uma2 family endonuclease [Streptomyces alkaliterrae]
MADEELLAEFEQLARVAVRSLERPRLEFVRDTLRVRPAPDGAHGRIVQWLTRACVGACPELWLHDQGLRIDTGRSGRARPDGVLAPSNAFVGHPEWADPALALMVADITPRAPDTPSIYAEAGIPVHLLIDRDHCTITVFSEPGSVRYARTRTVPFGKPVDLPPPVGITLDTEPLRAWVR